MAGEIIYSIFDPTGNITALVETRVETEKQPAAADEIMRAHPEVEQVGFVYFEPGRAVPVLLRMAGGEFCGNAAMSAAALYKIRTGDESPSVMVRVSGALKPLEVSTKRHSGASSEFDVSIEMPPAISIEEIAFDAYDMAEELPVVRMEGITHIVIEEKMEMFSLKNEPGRAESAVKKWCSTLGAEGLGAMFLGNIRRETPIMQAEMTPLVYVPGADTMFWETSCASGTAAVGMYLSDRSRAPAEVALNEPGGTLSVVSDAAKGVTRLRGTTGLIREGETAHFINAMF